MTSIQFSELERVFEIFCMQGKRGEEREERRERGSMSWIPFFSDRQRKGIFSPSSSSFLSGTTFIGWSISAVQLCHICWWHCNPKVNYADRRTTQDEGKVRISVEKRHLILSLKPCPRMPSI